MGSYSDSQLAVAVAGSHSWRGVLRALGLAGTSSGASRSVRRQADRLGLDIRHFAAVPEQEGSGLVPLPQRLPRAGTLLAAAWFELCGWAVSWPLEPSPFDLVATRDRATRRVQVKTTRHRVNATWRVKLTSSTRSTRTYDPEDVDDLFVATAHRTYFLIPFARVAALSEITHSAYGAYEVPPP